MKLYWKFQCWYHIELKGCTFVQPGNYKLVAIMVKLDPFQRTFVQAEGSSKNLSATSTISFLRLTEHKMMRVILREDIA